ncbi:MAG: glycerol dehydratase reactivase beta/small subunit family protein [Chloroflexota bacterium]
MHVTLPRGVDDKFYRWVEIGAEEEGVPCGQVQVAETEPVAAAYAAAQSSPFEVGVAVTPQHVVLHKAHMPPTQPVLAFVVNDNAPLVCRLVGGNAARLVIRQPLRFEEEQPAPRPRTPDRSRQGQPVSATATDGATIRALARAIAAKTLAQPAGVEPLAASIQPLGQIEGLSQILDRPGGNGGNPPESPLDLPKFLHLPGKLGGAGEFGTHPQIDIKLIAKVIARIVTERGLQ